MDGICPQMEAISWMTRRSKYKKMNGVHIQDPAPEKNDKSNHTWCTYIGNRPRIGFLYSNV